MTKNELKAQAKWAIIDKLEEGYEGYLCNLPLAISGLWVYIIIRN